MSHNTYANGDAKGSGTQKPTSLTIIQPKTSILPGLVGDKVTSSETLHRYPLRGRNTGEVK